MSNSFCADCLYATNFLRPLALPKPEMKSFLGIIAFESGGPSTEDQLVYDIHKYRHDHQMLCQRYPKAEIVNKKYCCGEHKDRFDVQNEQPAPANAREDLGSC